MSDFPGKTSKRRLLCTTTEEFNLRTALWEGKITFKQFEKKYNELKKKGLIKRNGRVIK